MIMDADSSTAAAPATQPPVTANPAPVAGPDFHNLYAGLDGLDNRLTSQQKAAFGQLDKVSQNPKEDRARSINQLWAAKRTGLDPKIIESNWPAVKQTIAKEEFGIDSKEDMPDTALYGTIAKRYEPAEEGNPWAIPIVKGMAALHDLSQWHKNVGSKPLMELPDVPNPEKLPNVPIPGLIPGMPTMTVREAGYTWNLVKPQLEGMESPEGIASLVGFGAVGKMAESIPEAGQTLKAMSGVFAVVMAKAAKDGQAEIERIKKDPNHTTMDVAKAYASQAGNIFGTLLGAFGVVHEVVPGAVKEAEGKPISEAPEAIVAEAGKVADPEKRQAAVEAANKIAEVAGVPKVEMKTEGEPETTGVAQRVTEIEPGEGVSPEASVEKGRELLKGGADPEAAMDRFKKTGAIKADDIALVRAREEQLAKAASDAGKQFGYDSPEYEAAAKAQQDWREQIKPMQTEWSKIGAAQQGETDIDTGDFHALRTKFQEVSGRDFTPEESQQAQKLAKGVKDAQDAATQAKEKVAKEIKGGVSKDDVTGDIWRRAKEYLDKGEDDFDDIRHKIAADTGLPIDEVTKRLAGPKRMRVVTNDMWSKMNRRRMLVAEANYWIKKTAIPGWERAIKGIPGIFFRAKVRFHGSVGLITHAGMNIFNPTEWGTYWPKFVDQFRMMGWHDSGAYHERVMQDLERDPNYVTARRAGLANDALRGKDDYERAFHTGAKLFGKIDAWGSRGFDTLKTYRQARFNLEWDRLPAGMQTKEYAKALADTINHSTGYVRADFPKALNSWAFAPKLEGSRWAFLGGDSARSGKTFVNWAKASDEEKGFAIRDVKQKAIMAGTYIGLLAANEGLLKAMGSKQKINYTDPRKPDFLAFKGAGFQFGVVSPLIGSMRYMTNMFHAAFMERSKAEGKDSRFEEMTSLTGKYARGKLSPFGEVAADVATGSDFQNRPLPEPIGRDKEPKYLEKEGVKPYTMAEYAAETALPIPLEDAIKEIWKDQGMSDERIKHWIGVLTTIAVEGGTGARMSPDIEREDKTKEPHSRAKRTFEAPQSPRNIDHIYR